MGLTDDRDRVVGESLNQFFELVHVADLILQMVDVYYTDDVVPYIDATDFLSKINSEKKAFERNLDDNVALGMDRAIQVLIEHADFVLETEQGVADFNPPPGKPFDMKPTKTCRKVVELLTKHAALLRGVTDKATIDMFLQEIGIRVFTALVKHFKGIQVSRDGSMQLICDINAYYDWSLTLRQPETTKLFAVLKEIGNLFMVDGGPDLRELVHDHERFQGRLRPEEILELLRSRTDFKKIEKNLDAADCVVM
ncbi:F-box protein: endocytic membrane traffic, recycling ReCYcling 1 [Gonapodya sp. JEL0774]|nr:F-box protein: endocytic membrane traffic, recycling ReCYcling 1 [Gonapodya sp. JEL0774]